MMAENRPIELTPEQRRFRNLLANYPQFFSYWDFEKRECNIDGLKQALGVLSSGEQIMARFLCGVWCGNNVLDFDMIEAARVLDDEARQIVLRWFTDPEFP